MDFLRNSLFGGVQNPISSRRAFGAPEVAQGQGGSMPLKHKDFLRNSPFGGVQTLIFSRRAFGAPEVVMVRKNTWA